MLRAELHRFHDVMNPITDVPEAAMCNSDRHDVAPAARSVMLAEIAELRGKLVAAQRESARLNERQQEIMSLLDCRSADHLLHDLRNVLNERTLYRTLADMSEDQTK